MFKRIKKENSFNIRSLFEAADFADFMIISLTSGQTTPIAFMEAQQVISDRSLSACIQSVITQYGVGTSFSDSIERARSTCQNNYFIDILDTIAVSLKMGTNLVEGLESQSDTLRRIGATLVEESAAKAPIKMLFPMVCFIFPAIFILLGSGVVRDLLQALK